MKHGCSNIVQHNIVESLSRFRSSVFKSKEGITSLVGCVCVFSHNKRQLHHLLSPFFCPLLYNEMEMMKFHQLNTPRVYACITSWRRLDTDYAQCTFLYGNNTSVECISSLSIDHSMSDAMYAIRVYFSVCMIHFQNWKQPWAILEGTRHSRNPPKLNRKAWLFDFWPSKRWIVQIF